MHATTTSVQEFLPELRALIASTGLGYLVPARTFQLLPACSRALIRVVIATRFRRRVCTYSAFVGLRGVNFETEKRKQIGDFVQLTSNRYRTAHRRACMHTYFGILNTVLKDEVGNDILLSENC